MEARWCGACGFRCSHCGHQPGTNPAPVPWSAQSQERDGIAPKALTIVIQEGPRAGVSMHAKHLCEKVGRNGRKRATMIIADDELSEAHAMLSWHDGQWNLRDIGSSNGTYLNGAELESGGEHVLFGRGREMREDEAGSAVS